MSRKPKQIYFINLLYLGGFLIFFVSHLIYVRRGKKSEIILIFNQKIIPLIIILFYTVLIIIIIFAFDAVLSACFHLIIINCNSFLFAFFAVMLFIVFSLAQNLFYQS
jgi:ACR3 family arsenite efflux pump ArsB